MRGASTVSPSASSAAWDDAAAVSSASSPSAGHSACQPPSGRSSTAAPAPASTPDASPGASSAVRLSRTLSTGFCFCGIAEDAPRPGAVGSRSSPISGRDRRRTSLARRDRAAATSASAPAARTTGVLVVCHGASGTSSPSCPAQWCSSRCVGSSG